MIPTSPLVGITHRSVYWYDRDVFLGPQVIRLRPAPWARTPVSNYQLTVLPEHHFIAWGMDANGNHMARVVVPDRSRFLEVRVELQAELTPINPFGFFVEPWAQQFPFAYKPTTGEDLYASLQIRESGPLLMDFLATVDRTPRSTVEFLVDLNKRIHHEIEYSQRHSPGVHTCEELLTERIGSCRDSSWLMIQLLRHCGIAARFVSGYLVQLKTEQEQQGSGQNPAEQNQSQQSSGTSSDDNTVTEDQVDLHAWVEAYLPGAGWIGMDPTSGLFTAEGHIPVAAAAIPDSAAPITGSVEPSEVEVTYDLSLKRLSEPAMEVHPNSSRS